MFRKRPPAVSSSLQNAGKPVQTKRRFVRTPVDLPVDYTVAGRDGARRMRIDNLGGGGIRLETDEDLAAGTILALSFALEGTAVSATGRVVMSFFDGGRKRFLHGVAFTSIDPALQGVIVRHAAERQPQDEA